MSISAEARTLGDVLRANAKRWPEKVALETLHGAKQTFAEWNSAVNRLCAAVAALGLKPGARVAILSKNRPEYFEVYGLAKAGYTVVPLNWRLAPAELGNILEHSEAELLFADEFFAGVADRIRANLACVRTFVLIGAERDGWVEYETLKGRGQDVEPVIDVRGEDVACLMYTSGTTGVPKGVELTHTGVIGNARIASSEVLRLSEHDRTMAVMPLFHAGGMWYHAFPSLASGCTTLLLSEFDPAVVLKELQRHKISNVHLVPTMISAMLVHPAVAEADLSAVRLIFYAASSMPADLLRRAMQAFPRCGFAQAYGSTEAGIVTVLTPEAHVEAQKDENLLSACGRPVSSHRVRIVSGNGRQAAEGEIGEIEVASANIMKGYLKNENASKAVFDGTWLKTGDLGHFDKNGYLYIVDRKNDMVVTGGENVFPTEVESVLYRDPDIQEAAVFGIPDPLWVEKVVAAVVLKPGAKVTTEELGRRMKAQLAGYKCPREIFLTESLPKSAVGKILRKELRKQFAPH